MSRPDVTIVVVSWNVQSSLRHCLRSVYGQSPAPPRVIVIDNASFDGSADMVDQEFPGTLLIRNKQNRGFAAAVNQGIKESIGDVLLLNPDVVLQPDTIERLQRYLSEHPRVGIIGPRLEYPDGSLQPSVKRFPRWIDLWLTLSKLPNVFPRLVHRYQASSMDYHQSQSVDQVMGSCFYIRRQVIDEIGMFDEGFWIWFEEVDFCLRAKHHHWDINYLADAKVVHAREQSFRQVRTREKQKRLRQSVRHYAEKHFPVYGRFALLPAYAISWLSAWIIDATRAKKPLKAKEL